MRKQMITLAATATLLSTVALMSGSAQAMTLGAPAGVRGAAEALNPVDNVACWRYGYRGWGWYPCGYWRGGWHRGWGWRHRWH